MTDKISTEAFERMTKDNAPKEIRDLLEFPYVWISKQLKGQYKNGLDIGCGSEQLGNKYMGLESADIADNLGGKYDKQDITKLTYKDNQFDLVVSLETIEHVKQQAKALEELLRVSNRWVFLGSVNRTGPDFIKGVEIYKGEKNPYHVKELDRQQLQRLVNKALSKIKTEALFNLYFSNLDDAGNLVMESGFNRLRGFCNYVLIEKLK